MKKYFISIPTIMVLSMLFISCSTNKKSQAVSDSTSRTESKKGFPSAPPVGPPTYAPGMVGVEAEVLSTRTNGDEILFEIEVKKILGSGAASAKPNIGEKISLNYPVTENTKQSSALIVEGSIIHITLSNTPSITEGGEQWFCEKVHLDT